MFSMTGDSATATKGPSRIAAAAWVLYDLANTVYAATVTFLFTPYFEARFGSVTGLGLTQTASLLLAAVLVPLCGAIVDRTKKTRLYLSIATLSCIAAMAGMGLTDERLAILACFFLANVAYNLGLLFYNSLLPSVSRPERAGLVSGIGVGVGYVGTILVLVVLLPLGGAPQQFWIAASMFLTAALPCMFLVKDRRTAAASRGAASSAFASIVATVRKLPSRRPLFWFLLANFCLVDVLNTAILFFASFTKNAFAASAKNGSLELFGTVFRGDAGLNEFVGVCGLCLNGFALLFGIALGSLSDRRPIAIMRVSAIALLAAVLGGVAFGGAWPLGYVISLGVLGSLGLSGLWTAGRKVVVLLSPPDRIGEHFGLYGITLKLSVAGSTIYALVADTHGSKAAMLTQVIPLLLGLFLLSLVQLPRDGDAVRPA